MSENYWSDDCSEVGSTYSGHFDPDLIIAADPVQVSPSVTDNSTSSSEPSAIPAKRKAPDSPISGEDPHYKKQALDLADSLAASLGTEPSTSASGSGSSNSPSSGIVTNAYVIAHNASVQGAMDARGLPWGVQFEIARLVSLDVCKWHHVEPSKLDLLRTHGLSPEGIVLHTKIGPHVEDVFRRKHINFGSRQTSEESEATSPWEELDMEDAAFRNHGPLACLGFTPELGSWYGGKVEFAVRLGVGKDGALGLTLERPNLGPSSRFTRRYGSAWLLHLRISKEAFGKPGYQNRLEAFLLRPFVLNGQVFRFFYANKEHSAYLMATGEAYYGDDGNWTTMPHVHADRPSLLEFLAIHNNLEANSNQTMAKWVARLALGLSNSVPGLKLEPGQIKKENDIISAAWLHNTAKPPSEMDMTDGCGLINLQALHSIHEHLAFWKDVPVAIQCRVAGAKGLLLQHPQREQNQWTHPCVWLRPSQTKIKYPQDEFQDPSQLIVDVLRASHMQSSISISKEMVINLAENGVTHASFSQLYQASLEAAITPLLDWDGTDAMLKLWAAVCKEGGVLAARQARSASGTARARGLRSYDQDDDSDDSDGDEDSHDLGHSLPSTAWWADEISGCPSSLEETVMTLLDSNFHPMSNTILAERLKIVIKKAVKSHISKYRILIPMSCSAFIVPDPLGVLEEGEIHVKCAERSLLRPNSTRSDRVIGDVLVSRNPCKLPTDIQKVKAVFKPELDDYINVIVFSVKGSRSLASMLGTGDYDGDRVDCIWQPSIVQDFSNAHPKYADPPSDLDSYFQIKNETVKDFLHRVPSTADAEFQIKELQHILLAPLQDSFTVGYYSNMHDNAVYHLGYSHPSTTLLAWIFCTVLDGAKTGKTVLPDQYNQDRKSRSYGLQFSLHYKTLGDKLGGKAQDQSPHSGDRHFVQRPSHLHPFIMDLMLQDIQKGRDAQYQRIDRHFKNLPKTKDIDLTKPWDDAETDIQQLIASQDEDLQRCGQKLRQALDAIKAHVVSAREAYMTELSKQNASTSNRGKVQAAAFTSRRIESRQDVLRKMSQFFVSGPPEDATRVITASGGKDAVARLRASFAYVHDYQEKPGGSRFPWTVAMRELCLIKTRARGNLKPVGQDFYVKMAIKRV
ncbi:RNA dependent RNA polymerase-domain-containing protein [Gloeopeniophorella convolvens]|nr:RNA dependent RNA polymerase-domain-containing protein [Gloeopeniophorella convolvens]